MKQLIYLGKAKGFPANGIYINSGLRYKIEKGKPIKPEPIPEIRERMLSIKGFCEEREVESNEMPKQKTATKESIKKEPVTPAVTEKKAKPEA